MKVADRLFHEGEEDQSWIVLSHRTLVRDRIQDGLDFVLFDQLQIIECRKHISSDDNRGRIDSILLDIHRKRKHR